MEKRTRNWSCIIYPRQGLEGEQTECPENWAEILGEMGVKCAVSPLHDKDVKPDGTPKKPHRHVVFAYDGVKTEKQAREDFAKIGGVGCEAVRSLYSMTRYLTHKDDKDKAQYSTLDVLTFGGYEYKRYVETKEDEERDTIGKMGKIFLGGGGVRAQRFRRPRGVSYARRYGAVCDDAEKLVFLRAVPQKQEGTGEGNRGV